MDEVRLRGRQLSVSKAAKRAAAMQIHELWTWANAESLGLGGAFDAWRRTEGPYEEVERCLEVMGALCAEINRRQR